MQNVLLKTVVEAVRSHVAAYSHNPDEAINWDSIQIYVDGEKTTVTFCFDPDDNFGLDSRVCRITSPVAVILYI